jgi:hypothetical protein
VGRCAVDGGGVTGEPARIRAFAVRLRGEAVVVRGTALRIAATEQVRWRSPAAGAFRGRVDGAARHLLRTARLLDEAAEAVDGHALAVERSLDELAALASRVLGSVTGGP